MSRADSQTVTILGAGVSGLTTAIVLELLGRRTRILAKDRADNPERPENPAFASLFPAASVIPHSIAGEDTGRLLDRSQRIFSTLLDAGMPGMQLNRHYELFEFHRDPPRYARRMNRFRSLAEMDPAERAEVPRRVRRSPVSGWGFDALFADWPRYLPQLFDWYETLGGTITLREVTRDSLPGLPSPLVNCTGLEGHFLFETPGCDGRVLKGHLLHVPGAPPLTNTRGQTVSYNYHPGGELYTDEKGNRQDLYCYPRSDGWILGGSRLEGRIDGEGNWSGTEPDGAMRDVNGRVLPEAIPLLNREILETTFGVNPEQFEHWTVRIGYRHTRNRQQGLRIEREGDLIHNYGHGGAGITLSWGSALRVAELLEINADVERVERGLAELAD